ncbi:hypothetical protein D018_3478A, partial [Vibrio parahaemolyticus VP2007-007]
MIGEIDRVA